MKHILVMFLALMLAGCNVTAFNVFAYDPYAAMQPTSTQAATVTARSFQAGTTDTFTPEPSNRLLNGCIVSAAEALNLRRGPGTNHAVIHVLKAGETLTRLPTPAAGAWIEVITQDGATGWVHGSYCDGR